MAFEDGNQLILRREGPCRRCGLSRWRLSHVWGGSLRLGMVCVAELTVVAESISGGLRLRHVSIISL